MPVKTYDLGPGTLTLGAGALAVAGQVRAFRVTASEAVATTSPVPVLSGEELAGSEKVSHTWAVAGSLIQDLSTGGVVDWSWDNKGTAQAFTFTPNTVAGAKVTGTLYPIPLEIGGDVTRSSETPGEPPTADFTWRCKGGAAEPTFTPS